MKKKPIMILNTCIIVMITALCITEFFLLSDTRDEYEDNQAVITVKEAERIRTEKIEEQNRKEIELTAEDFSIGKQKEENSIWEGIMDTCDKITEFLFGEDD